MARLVINPDTADAWSCNLPPGEYWVGRSPESGLAIDHPSVSPAHCYLNVSDRKAVLKDAASAEGTFVNGQRVEDAILQPGTSFRLGQVEMRFECDSVPDLEIELPPPPTVVNAQGGGLRTVRPMSATAATPVRTQTAASASTRFKSQPRGWELSPHFYKLLPGTLLYPFSGSGIILLVAGGVFSLLLGFLPIIGLLVTGYLFSYAKRMVASSAIGDRDPPDWPDFTNVLDDMIVPYLHLVALIVLTCGPAFIVRAAIPSTQGGYGVLLGAVYVLGAFIAPMAILSLSMFDSLTALNPIGLTWSILRIPVPYLVAAVAFGVVIGCYLHVEDFIRTVVPGQFLPYVAAGFVNLYLAAVAMRILGLLYFCKKDELGWFER